MEPQQLEELNRYSTSAAFSEAERTALRLADAMTDSPSTVPDGLFEELRSHLPEQQVAAGSSSARDIEVNVLMTMNYELYLHRDGDDIGVLGSI